MKAEPVRPLLPHRVGHLPRIASEPGVLVEIHGIAPTRVFPLGLRRQTVSRRLPVRHSDRYPIGLVERLSPVHLAQLVAELYRIEPGDVLNGMLPGRLASDLVLATARCEKQLGLFPITASYCAWVTSVTPR